MKNKTSLKQIAANRNNARKSTGPKTPAGKAASKMNAVKHGILSTEVVVRGLRIKESPREFKDLLEQFHEHLAPVGPMEEMLVERIVTTYWRLRRALTAETGEIALSVDGRCWKRSNTTPFSPLVFMLEFGDATIELAKSTAGISYLLRVLLQVRNDVTRDGELTEAAFQNVLRHFGNKSNVLTDKLAGFRKMLAENPEALSTEPLKKKHREAALRFVESEIRHYEFLTKSLEEREDREEAAHKAADVLPKVEVLDKILRYETTLERQLYRAMNQLERLQRRRNGEVVPPPISMEVSH